MPYEQVNDIRMYYEVHGDGDETLVIVPGMGGHHGSWSNVLPALSRDHRVVIADNRGAGLSDAPPGPYTMAQLVDDLGALHNALGLDSFHLYGESLGGMIALNYVLAFPQRVRSLILACTLPGGHRSVPTDSETLKAMFVTEGLSADELMERSFGINYSPEWATANRALLVERERSLAHLRAPGHANGAQAGAAREHDVHDRLGEIHQPTLVLHGTLDRIIPPNNAHLLADGIPGAELVLLDGVGHGMKVEAQALVEHHVLEFLSRQRQHSARA